MGGKSAGGGGSNSMNFGVSNSTYQPNPEAMAAYRRALGMAENVTSQPYEPYQGAMTAGFSPDQMRAFEMTRQAQGMAQPYINSATNLTNQALGYSDPRNFGQNTLQQFESPYNQEVVDATMGNLANLQGISEQKAQSAAGLRGAFGGSSGAAMGRAEVARQQGLANAQTLAQLHQSNYQQAVNQYNQQQQQAIQTAQSAAYGLGQLGSQAQNAALQSINALMGTGAQQQQLAQQQLTGAYNQWLQAKAYPYQQAAFYAGIAGGIAPNMGGTTNTTSFGMGNQQQQQAQGGGGGAGMLTSALSLLPSLFSMSDERTKTNIEEVGFDRRSGLPLYAYDDIADVEAAERGDRPLPPKRVSVMAQDLESVEPENVIDLGGLKAIRNRAADGGAQTTGQTQDTASTQSQSQQSAGFGGLNGSSGTGVLPTDSSAVNNFIQGVFDPRTADQMARAKWVNQPKEFGQSAGFSGDNFQIPPALMNDGGATYPYDPSPGEPKAKGGVVAEDDDPQIEGELDRTHRHLRKAKWVNKGFQPEAIKAGFVLPDVLNGREVMADGGMPGFGGLMRQQPYGNANAFVPNPSDFGVKQATDVAREKTGQAASQGLEKVMGGHGGGGGHAGDSGPKVPEMKIPKPSKKAAAADAANSDAQTSADPLTEPKSNGDLGSLDAPQTAEPTPQTQIEPSAPVSTEPPVVPEFQVNNDIPLLQQFGGFGGFADGGRVHKDGGGAAGAPGGAGLGGVGAPADASVFAQNNSLGDIVLGNAASPGDLAGIGKLMAGQEKLTGSDLLNKMDTLRFAHSAGPQLSPVEQGQPAMPSADYYTKPRTDLPSVIETEHYGEENPNPVPGFMMMAGMGGKGGLGQMGMMGLASQINQQNAANDAAAKRAQLSAQRKSMLNDPANFPVEGYYSKISNPNLNEATGLFNLDYTGAYRGYPFKDGGRVAKAGGGPIGLFNQLLNRIASGIAAIETGGRSNAYGVRGPRSKHGDYPYGKYQIMGANIPAWGRAAGYPNLTIDQFRRSPKIQEDVARTQFANMLSKSGNPLHVAGEWLGGPSWRTNKHTDVLGTSVPVYMRRFANAFSRAGGQAPNLLASNAVANQKPQNFLPMIAPQGTHWHPSGVLIDDATGNTIRDARSFVANARKAIPAVAGAAAAATALNSASGAQRSAGAPLTGDSDADFKNAYLQSIQQPASQAVTAQAQNAEPPTIKKFVKGDGYAGLVDVPNPNYHPDAVEQPSQPHRWTFADLNPIGAAHAEEAHQTLPSGVVPQVRAGFEPMQGPSQHAGVGVTKQLLPSAMEPPIGMPRTGITGLDMEQFNMPGMADRDLMGAQPQGFGTINLPLGSTEEPMRDTPSVHTNMGPEAPVEQTSTSSSPSSRPAEKTTSTSAKQGQKYWGDWRDAPEHRSDFGDIIDELAGDKRMSNTAGKANTPMGKFQGEQGDLGSVFDMAGSTPDKASADSAGFDLGGLFPEFASGGAVRHHFAAGGPSADDEFDPIAGLGEALGGIGDGIGSALSSFGQGFGAIGEDQGERNAVAAEGSPTPRQTAQQPPQGGEGGLFGGGGGFTWSPIQTALLTAGLRMMASDRVNPLQAIGEGGLAGVNAYMDAKAYDDEQQAERQKQQQTQQFMERLNGEPPSGDQQPQTSPEETAPAETKTVTTETVDPKTDTTKTDTTKTQTTETQVPAAQPATRTSSEGAPKPVTPTQSPTAQYDMQIARLRQNYTYYSSMAGAATTPAAREALRTKLNDIKYQISNLVSDRDRAERQSNTNRGTIGIIGQDAFGNPIRGWVSGPNIGKPLQINSPDSPNTAPGEIPNDLHYDALIERLPAQQQAYIKGIADGSIKPPTGPRAQQILSLVTAYDPTWNTDKYEQRRRLRSAYEPQGKVGQQMSAASGALQHAEQLLDAHNRLGNTNWHAVNAIVNPITRLKENPALNDFETNKLALIGEVEKYLKGGSPAEASLREMAKQISPNSTPAEIRAVLHKIADVMGGKTKGYINDWNKVFGNIGTEIPINTLPHDMEENERIEKLLNYEFKKSQSPSKQKPTGEGSASGSVTVAPQQGDEIERNGVTYIWDDNAQKYLRKRD